MQLRETNTYWKKSKLLHTHTHTHIPSQYNCKCYVPENKLGIAKSKEVSISSSSDESYPKLPVIKIVIVSMNYIFIMKINVSLDRLLYLIEFFLK